MGHVEIEESNKKHTYCSGPIYFCHDPQHQNANYTWFFKTQWFSNLKKRMQSILIPCFCPLLYLQKLKLKSKESNKNINISPVHHWTHTYTH